MAMMNVRVEDEILAALDELAAKEGLSRSDTVRRLITEAVSPPLREIPLGDLAAPETMTPMDRKMLSMLHRILARVLPEDSNDVDGDSDYQLDRARALEEGFVSAYADEFAGFAVELSKRESDRLMDILDLFSIAKSSMRRLEEAGDPVSADVAETLTYSGLDYNDPREGRFASYVQFLLDQGRWANLADDIEEADGGNSHGPMFGVYFRMLAVWLGVRKRKPRPVRSSDFLLSKDELEEIAAGAIPPRLLPRR